MQVYVQQAGKRVEVFSLAPYLKFDPRCVMDAALMREEERGTCRWVGFGIGKGVTDPIGGISVYAVPAHIHHGLHGELIQGLGRVDPIELCYERNHVLGFGYFVRWVYLHAPCGSTGVVGVDWSLLERPSAGVAHSMQRVALVANALLTTGIQVNSELALLNCRMCEHPDVFAWRRAFGLITVADWASTGRQMFGPNGSHCPRCGLPGVTSSENFCQHCGCEPRLIWDDHWRTDHGRTHA